MRIEKINTNNKVKRNSTSSHYQINFFSKKTIILKTKIMNIIGRLVKNAEVRTLSNDKEVVNFSIAVNDSYKNKQGERVEQTAFLDCAYWLTAKVAQFLTKGTLVELTGRLSTRAWIGKDGEAHAGLNFHTSQVKLHGGGKERTVTQDAIKTQTAEAMNIQSEVEDLPF